MKSLYLSFFSFCIFTLATTACDNEAPNPSPLHYPKLCSAYLEDGSLLEDMPIEGNEQHIKFQIKDADKRYFIFKSDITCYTLDKEGKVISKNRYQSDSFKPNTVDFKEMRFEWGYVYNNQPDGYTIQIRENKSDHYRKIEFNLSVTDSTDGIPAEHGHGFYYPVQDNCDFTITQAPLE